MFSYISWGTRLQFLTHLDSILESCFVSHLTGGRSFWDRFGTLGYLNWTYIIFIVQVFFALWRQKTLELCLNFARFRKMRIWIKRVPTIDIYQLDRERCWINGGAGQMWISSPPPIIVQFQPTSRHFVTMFCFTNANKNAQRQIPHTSDKTGTYYLITLSLSGSTWVPVLTFLFIFGKKMCLKALSFLQQFQLQK